MGADKTKQLLDNSLLSQSIAEEKHHFQQSEGLAAAELKWRHGAHLYDATRVNQVTLEL